jgi:hypothetical protein
MELACLAGLLTAADSWSFKYDVQVDIIQSMTPSEEWLLAKVNKWQTLKTIVNIVSISMYYLMHLLPEQFMYKHLCYVYEYNSVSQDLGLSLTRTLGLFLQFSPLLPSISS